MNRAFRLLQPFSFDQVELDMPECGADEMLLQILYIGLCGTDLSSYRGKMPLVSYPRIPGHEIAATILEKGSNVPDGFRTGDTVTVNPYTSCGQCPACQKKRFNTCEFNQTLGVQRDGALRQYFTLPWQKVIANQDLKPEHLVLAEPLSIGYHATERAGITNQDTVVVLGCGMIGIGVALAALHKQATVIAIDREDSRLALLKEFGVDHLINGTHQDVLKTVQELTRGRGADVVIEAAGSPLTYQQSLEIVSYAGRVVAIGYAPEAIPLNTSLIVKKELNVMGSRNALHEFEPVLELIRSRGNSLDPLISGIYPLEDAGEAFRHWHQHPEKVIKLLVKLN
jgi:threonine dehydrogenase-like Zn-dependent dehydrogenase